VLPERDAEV